MAAGAKKSEGECARLSVGSFCIELGFSQPDYTYSFRDYYAGFLTDAEPDLRCRVEVISHDREITIPTSLFVEKEVDGNKFSLHGDLLVGEIDLAARLCEVRVKRGLFAGSAVRVFEQFLYQLYYTLAGERHDESNSDQALVHSSGVEKDGFGYVFYGPSMAGKSTIAKLSSDYRVLNDEIVLVRRSEEGYRAIATPFNGEFRDKENRDAPLRAIFRIVQGSEHEVRRISQMEAVESIYPEVVFPETVLQTRRGASASRVMDFSKKLAESVPFFELRFLPNAGFWKSINDTLTQDPETSAVSG